MRINKFLALATGVSRREADRLILSGRVVVDGITAEPGTDVIEGKTQILLDDQPVKNVPKIQTIIFNKPVGYVVSRNGEGKHETIYDVLPTEFHHLKPVGRLDKYSSGLLLLTNDGKLAQELTHPSFQKTKIYEVSLSLPLQPLHRQMISEVGIQLEDGRSQLALERQEEGNDKTWVIKMHEGRNRQIRRTFSALGYHVSRLRRIQFGNYKLDDLKPGEFKLYLP